MLKSLALVFANVLIGASGQLMLKVGMTQVGRIGAEHTSHPVETLLRIFTTSLILMALPLYGGALILWLVAISRLDLSFAYPLLALAFVLNPLLARLLLGEGIPWERWVGILVICVCVVIVSRTGR
jgi:drug/metabolite transporter (DMT)-like permease